MDHGADGQDVSRASRPLRYHTQASKDIAKLDKPLRARVEAKIQQLHHGEPDHTTELVQSLKDQGYHSTRVDSRTRIIHRDEPSDNGLEIGGVFSQHDYDSPKRRLGGVQAAFGPDYVAPENGLGREWREGNAEAAKGPHEPEHQWGARVGEHTAPNGTTYRLVHKNPTYSGSVVTAHAPLKSGKGYRGVGFLSYTSRPDKGPDVSEIHKVNVHPDHQRQGIASAMLAFARESRPELQHSTALSPSGRAWSEHVGVQVPPEGLSFTHDDIPTGGSKHPIETHLRAIHPEHGQVGAAIYFPPKRRDGRVVIRNLHVENDQRRQGIGSALMDEIQRRHPDSSIDHGDRTNDGENWWSGYADGKSVHRGRTATRHCPCGMALRRNGDEWEHADGSVSHDGEFYGKSVSDLMRSAAKSQIYYHVSDARNRDSIAEHGLSLDHSQDATHIWLHPDEQSARNYRDLPRGRTMDGSTPENDIYRVDATGYRTSKEPHGVHDFGQRVVKQSIPPERLERISARFTPTQRVFTHTDGLDHRLWAADGQLRPEVRAYIMGSIARWWSPIFRDWAHWARIYFAGSEASEWTSSNLEGNDDFDILIGVDYDKFRAANPMYADLDNQAISDMMNQGFKADNGPVYIEVDGIQTGPWDRTSYVNTDSLDIRAIKPYAAYDVGRNYWVVKPPHLPHWTLDDLPKPVVRELRAIEAYVKAVLKLPEPMKTQQGNALFEHLHSDRSRAFSDRGEGWYDPANLAEKWLDQEGLWVQLVQCAHNAKEGMDLAPHDWSNTPPGYTALRRQAMPWHEQNRGESAQAVGAKSVRRAGFKGYVSDDMRDEEMEGNGHDDSFDEDAYDRATPEPTREEADHYDRHGEYPDTYHERHDEAYGHAMQAKQEEDEPDHEDPHLHHFIREHGAEAPVWKAHGPQPVSVDLRHGVYATQSHVAQKHIDRYLSDPGDKAWHLQTHPNHQGDDGYLGHGHPMFVTHHGELHATEGHHRVAAALQRGDSHIMGWHYDLDKHPIASNYHTGEPCEDCQYHQRNAEDEDDHHYGARRHNPREARREPPHLVAPLSDRPNLHPQAHRLADHHQPVRVGGRGADGLGQLSGLRQPSIPVGHYDLAHSVVAGNAGGAAPGRGGHPQRSRREAGSEDLAGISRVATARPDLYGAGDPDALFRGSAVVPTPFAAAGRSKSKGDYDKGLVTDAIREPQHHQMQDVDPRILHSTQPSVTRAGVQHYLTDHYEHTGETFADMHNPGNRRPVVYAREDGQHLLLSGHHRAAAALLRGRPLQAVVVHGPWGPPRGGSR